MKRGKKWIVFVTAPDQVTGEMWCSMLQESGIHCQLRDANPGFIGPSAFPVRLMAPEDECELALHMLEQNVTLRPRNEAHAMRNRRTRIVDVETEERSAEPNPG